MGFLGFSTQEWAFMLLFSIIGTAIIMIPVLICMIRDNKVYEKKIEEEELRNRKTYQDLHSIYAPKLKELVSKYVAKYNESGIKIKVEESYDVEMDFWWSMRTWNILDYATRKYTTEKKNHIFKEFMSLEDAFYSIDIEYGTDHYHDYIVEDEKIWDDFITNLEEDIKKSVS